MVISIRRSQHEEGEELVAIWCRSVDATHDFLSAEYRAELEELVRSFLPEAPLWVAVNERDQPVGFMLLSGQHMDALFIDPDVRGCGVGRMLVEHALSMAPELTTNVNEQNEQAVGFYKKVGFKVTGRFGETVSVAESGVCGGISRPCRACPGWRRRASVASDLFLHQRKKAQSSDWAFCLI